MYRVLNKSAQLAFNYSYACKFGRQCISVRHMAEVTEPAKPKILPDNFKWDDDELTKEAIAQLTAPSVEIQGTLIPLSEQYFLQKIFFVYNYPIMHFMNTLVGVMPMWSVVMATTLTYRLLMFPQMIKVQRVVTKTHNIMPETQKIQTKMNQALASGNNYESSVQKHKLDLLFKKHNLTLMQRIKPHLIQVPGAACIFLTLNALSKGNVECMVNGGALWFTNLCVPDPLYILPLVASASTYIMMEMNSPTSVMQPIGRWVVRAIPLGLFIFMLNFPSSVALYWAANNLITLVVLALLRRPALMKFFNIPQKIIHDPTELPLVKQTLQGQVKSALEQSRKIKTTEDLRRIDDIAFRRAAIGPLRKTFKEDPTRKKVD